MAQELNAALEELDSGSGPKRLHRCRVRLKRARALGRVGKAVAPGQAAVFNDSARTVMRQLGQARDLVALAATARKLAEKANHKSAAGLIHAADALETERDHLPALDLDAVRGGIRDLIALAQVWPEPSARQIRSGAKHIAKRARRTRGRKRDEAARRHDWRKREKERLYAATLLDDVWPGPRRRKTTKALGQLLGRERDALLLLTRIEAEPALAGDADAAERAERALRKYATKLRKRADKLGERLH
jgi:CHAD domain-containing protein